MKPDATAADAKNGKGTAKVRASKTSASHWLTRVYRPSYTGADGQRRDVAFWWVRMERAGRRHAVNLGTPDRREAATKAAKLFADLISRGWDAALASIDPERYAPREGGTVGDVVSALERIDLHPRTRLNYQKAMRWWSARHLELRPGRQVYARQTADWHSQLDAVPLSTLSVQRIERIRDIRIAKAKGDAVTERRARVTLRSWLRNARAAVSAAARLGRMQFAEPRPFHGVTVAGAVTTPYRSRIDPAAILRDARASLADQPDVYRVILLALGAGLRRAEIENLRWRSVDVAAGRVWVEASGGWRPKTAESEAAVDVDAGLLREIQRGGTGEPGALVVPPGSTKAAVLWLRSRGVDGNKPLHTLRKEFGSIVAHSADLLTASRQLRHSSLAVTAGVYVEARKRAAPKIGEMLGG